MINFAPPHIDDVSVLDEFIMTKHNPHNTNLSTYRTNILNAYDEYDANQRNLENLNASPTLVSIKHSLHLCYESGIEADDIKSRVHDNLPTVLLSKCPYCLISEPKTFDHYVGKEEFPEFSIYSSNLIPCCPICNSYKSDDWRNTHGRIIINNYFDVIPTHEFLFFDIGMSGGLPAFKDVRLHFTAPTYTTRIIEAHFDKLHLFERYKDEAVSIIQEIVCEFDCKPKKTCSEVRETITQRINGLEKCYGNNFYRVAVLRGMLRNPDVINYLGV